MKIGKEWTKVGNQSCRRTDKDKTRIRTNRDTMLFEDLIYFSVCYVVSEIQAKSTIYVNKSLWTKKFGTLSPGIKKTRLNKYATFIVFSFRQTRITTKKNTSFHSNIYPLKSLIKPVKLITILSTAQFNLLILQSRCMIIHFLSCQSFPIWHYSCAGVSVVRVCSFTWVANELLARVAHDAGVLLFSFLYVFASGGAVLPSACISHVFIFTMDWELLSGCSPRLRAGMISRRRAEALGWHVWDGTE